MYYHKITEYGIKCCMHAHHVAPRAPPSRGELYRRKTLFLDDFPIFFLSKWDLDPPTSNFLGDFLNFFNFAKPLSDLLLLLRPLGSAHPVFNLHVLRSCATSISFLLHVFSYNITPLQFRSSYLSVSTLFHIPCCHY